MRHHSRIGFGAALAALLVALLVAVNAAAAQPGRRQPPPGAAAPRYDVTTVETVRGEVISIDTIAPGTYGHMAGVHLMLRTRTGPVSVHLGPAAYLQRQSLQLHKGETIEVRGSRVTMGGNPALLAARVTRGRQVLMLRDSAGLPVWRGTGRRPMSPRRP